MASDCKSRLQWSQVLMDVDRAWFCLTKCESNQLQWSHVLMDVDSLLVGLLFGQGVPRFNGATS